MRDLGRTGDRAAFAGWINHALLDVLVGMRADDRREVYATRPEHDPYALFADLVAMRPACVWGECVFSGDLLGPCVAFVGVFQRTPHVGSAVMIATPEFTPRLAAETARRVRGVVIPHCVQAGLHRVDCQSMSDHAAAHTFLLHCGATRAITPRRNVGKRRETFIEFYWLAEDDHA